MARNHQTCLAVAHHDVPALANNSITNFSNTRTASRWLMPDIRGISDRDLGQAEGVMLADQEFLTTIVTVAGLDVMPGALSVYVN